MRYMLMIYRDEKEWEGMSVQERGVARHGRGHVGVQIQGDPHGQIGADHAADRGEKIALSVLEPLRHHRPMQIEEDSVQRTGLTQVVQQPVLDLLVDVLAHAAGGRGGGRDGGHEREAALRGDLDHAAEARPGSAVGLEDLTAVAEVARRELAAIGGDGTERVGLVRDHGDEDAHATS